MFSFKPERPVIEILSSEAPLSHPSIGRPEYLRWDEVEARASITPKLLPAELVKYSGLLENLTPTSKGELSIAHAGLFLKILTSPSPKELYVLVDNVERYKSQATQAVSVLPEPYAFGRDFDMIGEYIRNNFSPKNALADYLMAVDWVNTGKWQPKTRNGIETKALSKLRVERIEELQTFSNEGLGRLSNLVRNKQEYRQSLWQSQQNQLREVLQANSVSASSIAERYRIENIQSKMNELAEAIASSRPDDE